MRDYIPRFTSSDNTGRRGESEDAVDNFGIRSRSKREKDLIVKLDAGSILEGLDEGIILSRNVVSLKVGYRLE